MDVEKRGSAKELLQVSLVTVALGRPLVQLMPPCLPARSPTATAV